MNEIGLREYAGGWLVVALVELWLLFVIMMRTLWMELLADLLLCSQDQKLEEIAAANANDRSLPFHLHIIE